MASPVVVFDWDCTITSRHMFKTLAGWEGYGDALSNFCAKRDITDPLSLPMDFSICERMQFGGGADGDALLRTVFIEFFMGGSKRATEIKKLLSTLKSEGAKLCVLTRGETHSLHVLFDTVLQDWAPMFEGGWIGNTLNDFFTVEPDGSLSSVGTGLSEITGDCTKQQLLESVFPFTKYAVLLVDDDISPETDKVLASSAPGVRGGSISLLDLPLEKDGLQPTSISLLLSLVQSLDTEKLAISSGASDEIDQSLPVEHPSAAAAAGAASMMPQQQRGFAALQALVQRGGLEEMQRVLIDRDDDGNGFLSLHDMRAVLTDPNVRNAQASGTAAGWPVAEGTDYRRMLVGDPSDYRRLGLHLARPTATRLYYLTEDELNDVILLAARDATGRKVNYRELVELGASLLEVEGLKQLMTEGYVQILPQAPGSAADDDGGYTRRVREMTTLSNSSLPRKDSDIVDNHSSKSEELEEELIAADRISYRRQHGYLFPQWWFYVIAAPSIFPAIFLTAFQTVIWPAALASCWPENKTFVFAACGQVAVMMSWCTPAPARFGSVIDRAMPAWLVQRFGRRRPFIVCGHLCSAAGYLLLYLAVVGFSSSGSGSDFGQNDINVPWLCAGLLVTNLGSAVSSPAMNGIIPDTVPVEQRAYCLTIVTWTASVCTMLGFCVAWLLSEGLLFTDTIIWWINISMWVVDLPLLLIACNAEATCWSPEHSPELDAKPPPQSPISSGTTGSGARSKTLDLNDDSDNLDSSRGCLAPFRASASFRWYWVWLVLHGLSIMIESSFHYYWLQDCFPTPYRFLHWHVASNVNSAVSILGFASALLSIIFVAVVRPHWWRERFGGRQIILWTTVLSCFVRPFSYVLLPGNFNLVVLWTVYNAIAGSIASAASGTMQLECLPCDERGRPHAAAQDMNVYAWATLLPVTGFPLLLGKSVSWFPNHQAAYSWFWLVGGCVGVLAYAILAIFVHPQEEKLDGSCQCTRAMFRKERDAVRRRRVEQLLEEEGSELDSMASGGGVGIGAPGRNGTGLQRRGSSSTPQSDRSSPVGHSVPIGARLCDALLFGSSAERVADPEEPLHLKDAVAHEPNTGSLSIAGVALD